MLERRRCGAHHRAARLDRARQRYLGDAGMADQQPTGVDIALHHLEDAVRHPRLLHESGHLGGAERRELGGLEDHRIAESERRRGLPAAGLHGIVPGADAAHHAQRLAPRVAEAGRAEIDVLTRGARRHRGEVLEALRARDDIDDLGFLDGLAGIPHLDEREPVVVLAQQIGHAAQHPRALGAAQRRPSGLRSACAPYGLVDLFSAGDGQLGEQFTRGRVVAREQTVAHGGGFAAHRGRDRPRTRGRRSFGCDSIRSTLADRRIDHRQHTLTYRAAVAGRTRRQGRLQPRAVDQRGDVGGMAGERHLRHQRPQRGAQIGLDAALVDALDAGDAGRRVHLAPIGEPGAAVGRTQALGGQTGLDVGTQTVERTAGGGEPPTGLLPQPGQQLAERGLQQPVFVDEVVRHQPRRDIRLARDLCESGALDAHFCETFEGDLDELLTAGRVAAAGRRADGGIFCVVQSGRPRAGEAAFRASSSWLIV